MEGIKACLEGIWAMFGGVDNKNDEQQTLLAPHAFPHPSTILTPPRHRAHIPPPINPFPRTPRTTASAPITPCIPYTARPTGQGRGQSTPSIPSAGHKYGSISRAYQSRMQPLTRTSQPTTPTTARSAHLLITSKITTARQISNSPPRAQTTSATPLHTRGPSIPKPEPGLGRSISEPRSLYGMRPKPLHSGLFEPHQLQLTGGVEGVRRPRSSTTMTAVSPLNPQRPDMEYENRRGPRRSVSLGDELSSGAGVGTDCIEEEDDVVRRDLGLKELLGPGQGSMRGKGKGRGRKHAPMAGRNLTE